ncbi:hypothetical protein F2P56_024090 [Juglans regia]|uniref:Salicylate carboxymethyltransferase-like n=2 Tax=Juglans regia TaxID=51240 RepID=A0A833UMB7_JUGRE|nr:salicylate carboxymethyltransferase-like [Juglans regia]KAF5454424.1 hypothetical protein F2P56_024090 [Juglans regia]
MEVMKVLHMNGGMGDSSYANNSLVQQKVITMTKPITENAITQLYYSTLPKNLVIADLGCSSGPNTLFVVSELIKVVDQLRRKSGHDQSPEYQVFLNDLPGNDFNTIFKSLPSFQKKMRNQLGAGAGPCFFTGVPGSFYGRLFPSKTLHFVHSSYSLQWLSKVPEMVESNKGNIYMAQTSPPSVLRAYHAQFQADFSMFLKCRAEELVLGGRMVLTFLGRRSEDPSSKECCYIWELLAIVLNEMVSKGLIEEEKMDSFNIPQYTPSPLEVKSEIQKEGSFFIDYQEVSEVNWSVNNTSCEINSFDDQFCDGGYNVASCMRAVAEPLLVSHFGDAIIEEVFKRYREILSDRIFKENTRFFNVIVSLIKKE